jgi:hypothetical protein
MKSTLPSTYTHSLSNCSRASKLLRLLILSAFVLSGLALPAQSTLRAQSTGAALYFDGVDDYVTFGVAPELGVATFTLELWFNWTGGGTTTSTDTSKVTAAIPLLTKGRREADGDNRDLNYFLGIQDSRLVVDFEEGETTRPGRNHSVFAATPIQHNRWYHAAATYDGSVLKLYLNGRLEGELTVNRAPRSDSIQHAALGTAITSRGVPQGFFAGTLDEARIWNVARTKSEIQTAMNQEIASAPGLVGRWGLNEPSGTTAFNSVEGSPHGQLVNGPLWVTPGSPFDASVAYPPDVPQLLAPQFQATGVATTAGLEVYVDDPNGDLLEVVFYGRPVGTPSDGEPFTLMVIPDTQYYSVSDSSAETYFAQTEWIVAQKEALNILFAVHLGDLVNTADDMEQWPRASAAQAVLDDGGVPNSVIPGNHDQGTPDYAAYDFYFPPSRYQRFPWYGGYLGDPTDDIDDFGVDRQNKNNYVFFSSGGMEYIILNFELDVPQYAIDWGNAVLAKYPNHRAIVVTHAYLDATGARRTMPFERRDGLSAEYVWQHLIFPNCNIFLVLNGHYHGEVSRTDLNRCGLPVHQVLQNYQHRNGGNGWLRYYIFHPANDRLEAYTYSPTLNQFENDANSRFSLFHDMQTGAPFKEIGRTIAQAGATAALQWSGLYPATSYEWYAVATDGRWWTPSALGYFTTGGAEPINRLPIAVDDSAITTQDTPVQIPVLANDSDPDGDPLALVAISSPAHGTAVANPDGSVTYTPAGGWHGADSFTYTISDGRGGSDIATVTVTVIRDNEPPVAYDQALKTVQDTPIAITLLASDEDADTLNYHIVSPPAQGALSGVEPHLTYTPAPGFTGVDSLTYRVHDGRVESNLATITITVSPNVVNPVSTIPVANDAAYTLNQNESLVVAAPGVLATVTHAGGAPLAALLASGPAQGKLTLNNDGSFTYTPNAGYQGTDSFTFKASDGRIDSNVATVTLIVQPVNVHAPLVARDDSATTHQDTPVQIMVLANDGEQNGDTLTIVQVGNPVHGTAIPGAGGAITYTPPAGWLGIDSFTYTITGGKGGTATATVTVTVIPSPVEPEPPANYEDIHRLHLPLIHR